MGLGTSIKVGFAKMYLNRLKSVDGGTSIAGTLAAILMASQFIDLHKLMSGGFPASVEAGKVAVVFAFWLVMRLIGKPADINEIIQEAEMVVKEAQKQ